LLLACSKMANQRHAMAYIGTIILLFCHELHYLRNAQNTMATTPTTSTTSTQKEIFTTSVKCRQTNDVPLGWCLDDHQVPRYIGHEDNNELLYYTHNGYEKCLSKKTIIFIGDSRVRYQYMHLVSYLKNKEFMKCQDQEKYIVEASTTLPEDECHVINERMHGLGWNDWFVNSTNMLNSNSKNIRSDSISGEEKEGTRRQQISLCDCARPPGFAYNHFFENRYTKRNTQFGEINLIFLQNMNDVISMSEDFPPYLPFYYNNDNISSSSSTTTTTTRGTAIREH